MSPIRLVVACFIVVSIGIAAPNHSFATICIVPDNGEGTADLPPATPSAQCTSGYVSPSTAHMIVDGLAPGDTIEIGAEHSDFVCPGAVGLCTFAVTGNVCDIDQSVQCSTNADCTASDSTCPGGDCGDCTITLNSCDRAGGSLGGQQECAASTLTLELQGTGSLSAYSRTIVMPVEFETHTAPRTPGDAVQSFDTDMFRLAGQIPGGDPDFDVLGVLAGTDFSMPSAGHTTLTRVSGGDWNVDSFFDISYRIDFVGAASGPFAGQAGSTTGTLQMRTGETVEYDHLECFKMKDTVKLKGIVDLPTLAGTPYDGAGCKVSKAKKWCTPSIKIVSSSEPPATPLPGPALTSDYICYKLKCPKVSLTQGVQDQFGSRTLTKMKQGELCVPAVRVP